MLIRQVYIHHPQAEVLASMLGARQPSLQVLPLPRKPSALPADSAVITFQPPVWLADQRGVRWVHCSGAGVDGIEAVYPATRPVVTRTLGCLGQQLGEYALSYMLYRSQRIEERALLAEQRKWSPIEAQPGMLKGQRAILAGTGACARDIARLLSANGVDVLGVSRSGAASPGFTSVYQLEALGELLTEAQTLILALPATAATHHLLQPRHFEGARDLLVINLGRGSVVAGEVLLEAKRAGQIGMLVLDVFEEEPLPPHSPFWSEPGVHVTPHVAAVTRLEDIVEDFLASARDLEVRFQV